MTFLELELEKMLNDMICSGKGISGRESKRRQSDVKDV